MQIFFSVHSILFNFKINFHLWYIRGLIYVEIFYLFIKHKNNFTYLINACIVCIVCLIFLKYSLVIFNREISIEFVEPISKFLETAYVFFTIGIFIKKYINKVNINRVNNIVIILVIIFFMIMNIIEYILLEKFDKNVEACNYLNTFFLAISIFLFFIINPNLGKGSVLETIGKKHSLNIYIYHIIIMRILSFMIPVLGISTEIWKSTRTIIIFIVSIMFSFILNKIKSMKRKVEVNE